MGAQSSVGGGNGLKEEVFGGEVDLRVGSTFKGV